MKKNLTFIVIGILLIIIAILVLIINKNNEINYTELIDDVVSIKEDGFVINAVYQEDNHIYDSDKVYKGYGYIICRYNGGDSYTYVIYHNNKKIWEYTYYFLTDIVE